MILSEAETNSHQRTRGLLICGVALAPLFCAVLIIQFFTRAGFDVRRTPISLLSLGDLGWIQMANFIVTGLLAITCAVGIRRAWAGGTGGTWGPLLVATYGLGLVLAGIFHPDPGYDFPPGAPAGAPATMSSHAKLHNLAFLLVMVSLVAACFVFSRGFRSRGHCGWGTYSVVTGILAPVLIAAGIATHTILLITALPFVAFGWVSVVATRLRSDLREALPHKAEYQQ